MKTLAFLSTLVAFQLASAAALPVRMTCTGKSANGRALVLRTTNAGFQLEAEGQVVDQLIVKTPGFNEGTGVLSAFGNSTLDDGYFELFANTRASERNGSLNLARTGFKKIVLSCARN